MRTGAVALLVVVGCMTGCQVSGSGADDPARTSEPSDTSAATTDDTSPSVVTSDLDVSALARDTSHAGPVHFRTDLVYTDDLDHPITRLEGLVDWAEQRGEATEWADLGLYQGKPTQGLRRIGEQWATADGVVEQPFDSAGSPEGDPQPVDGTVLGLVGWSDTAATEPGEAGVEQILDALLAGQTFSTGEPDVVGGRDAVHYQGTPDDDGPADTEVWVSDDGLLVRLAQGSSRGGGPVQLVISLSDYGTRARIEPPPVPKT